MSWTRTLRQIEADQRREEREAQRRQKELARRAKEQAKLSELEQAKLEVEAYENQLEMVISIHKDHGPVWDWKGLAASLPPPPPRRDCAREFEAKQRAMVAPTHHKEELLSAVAAACQQDEHQFQEAVRLYESQLEEHRQTTQLAHRIVSGDTQAYGEALGQLSQFAEIAQLGSSVHFTIHSPTLVECNLKVNGTQVIPADTKSLTASGKLSVKATPRVRFHEVYQDYVCGCILRVAREVFALLPADTALINASVDSVSSATGHVQEQAVLSAVIRRAEMAGWDFDRLDPSDTVETCFHRGDFKASRKTEAFLPILPLTSAELLAANREGTPFAAVFAEVQKLRKELLHLAQTFGPANVEIQEENP